MTERNYKVIHCAISQVINDPRNFEDGLWLFNDKMACYMGILGYKYFYKGEVAPTTHFSYGRVTKVRGHLAWW